MKHWTAYRIDEAVNRPGVRVAIRCFRAWCVLNLVTTGIEWRGLMGYWPKKVKR